MSVCVAAPSIAETTQALAESKGRILLTSTTFNHFFLDSLQIVQFFPKIIGKNDLVYVLYEQWL
jgi:hypothetical protein